MNLASLQEENLKEFGEHVSLIFDGKESKNTEQTKRTNQFANGLKATGLKKGDRVLICMPNCPEVLLSYAAVWKAGGIITPVIFLLQAPEIAFIVKDCEPRFVVTNSDLLQKMLEACEGVSSIEKFVVSGTLNETADPRVVPFDKVSEGQPDTFIPEDMAEDDLAVILYTSGTTGRPKGVMLTHNNLYSNVMNIKKTREKYNLEFQKGKALSALPLSHAYGLFTMLGGWITGGCGVVLSWFDTEKVFQNIEKYKVMGMTAVPTMLIYMLNDSSAKKYDLSSLEIVACGASPLPSETKKEFEKKFNVKIMQGYGLTEVSTVATITPRDMPEDKPANCVGKAIEGVEVKIFDENDRELPLGEVGEVVVKGKNVTKGYYKLQEETEKTLRSGWLHTGDVGYMDAEGYLYLVERKRDLIIRGGFNIFPKDIEEALTQHPKVMEAAAVGVPHPELGEEVKAFVVPKIGEKPTEQELMEFCQTKLAKFKCPKSIEFRSFFPKNPIGKILKKELRAEASK